MIRSLSENRIHMIARADLQILEVLRYCTPATPELLQLLNSATPELCNS